MPTHLDKLLAGQLLDAKKGLREEVCGACAGVGVLCSLCLEPIPECDCAGLDTECQEDCAYCGGDGRIQVEEPPNANA